MGVLINEVCCIDQTNLADSIYENTQFTQPESNNKNDQYKALRKKSRNQFKNYSLDSFPLNEIGPSFNINDKPIKEVNSLSKVPISTQNVILQQTCNPLNYYDTLKKMGKGTFGSVYKVMHKQTGAIRAMKVISKKKLKHGFTEADILQEINVLTKLEHPHIIKIYEFYNYNGLFYIINEFCNEGDLSEKLNIIKKFPEFFVKILMVQIFNAVLYLHKKCVFHGDLKLENIMIDSFLSDDEPTAPAKKKQDNFISSLLADEKEINEYLLQSDLRRANTLVNFRNRSLNLNIKNSLFNKEKEGKNKISNSVLQKVSTISNQKFFRRKTIDEDKNFIKKKKTEPLFKEKKKKDPFSYLNGEVDDEEEEDEKNNEFNNKDFNELNDSYKNKKMNNINIYKNNIINNEQTDIEQIYNKKKQYLESINENEDEFLNIPTEDSVYDNNNNNINNNNEVKNDTKVKKTLTLNSMKIKNFELKLIDFGCAKIFSKYKTNFGEIIGTLIYCSPEVLQNNYNKECDIWSCGVIMYVLLSGHYPFYGKSEKEIKNKILSGKFSFKPKYFNNISDKAKDLISKCLTYDKNKRISAEEALQHQFFMDDINPNNLFEDEIDTKNILLSLKEYSEKKYSKIYQIVLTYLSHNFQGKDELNKLKKIFYKIDLNLDGKLSKSEFELAYREAGIEMSKEQIEHMMKSIDFDGNGFIEYEEFIRVALPKEKLFTEKNLKIAFEMFDLDKNGMISLEEFKTILRINKIKDKKVIKEFFKEIPIKENEEMTFEQFKHIFVE